MANVDVITGAGYVPMKQSTVSLYDAKGDLQSHLERSGIGDVTKEIVPGANDWLRSHGLGFLVPHSPKSNITQPVASKTTNDYLVRATVSSEKAKKLETYNNLSVDDAKKALNNPDIFIGDPDHDKNAQNSSLGFLPIAILGLSGILFLKLILK